MRICGIVTEYNPFHLGHSRHLSETRARLGPDAAVVCCMSGDFVQRGEAAILPKYLRAEAAVRCGADLVLELPAPYALLSAEGFAESAVSLLAGLNVITDLSFGAEDADVPLLQSLADTLLEHRTVQDTLCHLKTGISYAAAREKALYDRICGQAVLLRKPNNILAVEYCKAVQKLSLPWTLHAVPRVGAPHDGPTEDGLPSAAALRRMLRGGDASALEFLPPGSREVMDRALSQGLALLDPARLEHAALDRLCRMSPEDFSALPGAAEGLEHRIYAAVRACRSLDAVCASAKTRRYPAARIRRMLCCAYLDFPKELTALPPPYIRVLALSDIGRIVLRQAADECTLPILNKPAHVRQLPARAQQVFAAAAQGADLYDLALPAWARLKFGADWQRGAQYLPSAGPVEERDNA